MITEDYVSFETAKLLKEKGFDKYPIFPCYKDDGSKLFIDIPTTLDTINYHFIPAPTLQMAMKWLREKYDLHIEITSIKPYGSDGNGNEIPLDGVQYHANIVQNNKWTDIIKKFKSHSIACYCSYEHACEAAIRYCLQNLIGKKENNGESVESKPLAIITNTKTGKWLRAKFSMTLKNRACVNPTVAIVPENINDVAPVIGMPRLTDWAFLPKEEVMNRELHVEIFNKDKIKQDEYFLYNVWISGIDSETNKIVLSCDCVK